MKKKLKKIKTIPKKINKQLNKKVYVGAVVGDILVGTFIYVLLTTVYNLITNHTYEYIDNNNRYGTSTECYKKDDGYLYCIVEKKVHQYNAKK